MCRWFFGVLVVVTAGGGAVVGVWGGSAGIGGTKR